MAKRFTAMRGGGYLALLKAATRQFTAAIAMMLDSLAPPLAVLTAFGGVFAYGSWRAAKPADPLRPRLLPWRTLSLIAGFIAFIALIDLIAQIAPPA